MEQLTVKDLRKFCEQEIKAGNGDKLIVVSDDNEGNGFHGLFYGFTPCTEDYDGYIYDSTTNDIKKLIALG